MLVTNPRRINHEQLRILARNAKGGITHIYLHWTAGTYDQVFDDYHINIGEQGELYLTCNMLREYKRIPGVATVKPLASLSVALRMLSSPTNAILCLAHIHRLNFKWNRWRL